MRSWICFLFIFIAPPKAFKWPKAELADPVVPVKMGRVFSKVTLRFCHVPAIGPTAGNRHSGCRYKSGT